MKLRLESWLATFAAVAFTGCSGDVIGRARAQIAADPTSVDFGEAALGTEVVRPLVLENKGSAPLSITKLEILEDPRAAFAMAPVDSMNIPAGGSVVVTLRYSGGPVGSFDNARILVESTADNAPALSVPLFGRGLRVAAPDAGSVADADPSDGASEDASAPDDAGALDSGTVEGTWVTGAFGACSNTCGAGTWTRTVRCEDASGLVLPDASCPSPRPADTEACTSEVGCGCTSPACPGNVCTFDQPGVFTLDVPAGCASISARLWGGGGAGGSQLGATGGAGAFAGARYTVDAQGEQLAIWVAEPGTRTGDGGGASYLLRGSTPLLVAAGGGGGGSDGCSGCNAGGAGGAGGAARGEDGQDFIGTIATYCLSATGGRGADATAGGVGGTWTGTAQYHCDGEAGAMDVGGASNGGIFGAACGVHRASTWQAGGGQGNGGGGGGGAGRFGGGGAGFIWTYCAGGGGGGSSYADPASLDVRLEGGARATQANAPASSGAGRGGARDQPGIAGRVELVLEP